MSPAVLVFLTLWFLSGPWGPTEFRSRFFHTLQTSVKVEMAMLRERERERVGDALDRARSSESEEPAREDSLW